MMEYAKERRMRTAEEAIMTAADKLVEEGQLKAKRDMLTRLLDRRFGLTPEERDLIAGQSDVARLDAAIEAGISAVADGDEESKVEVLRYLSA